MAVSIRDTEPARLASSTVRQLEALGLLVDGDLTSLAAAQAAVVAGEAALAVTDRIYAGQGVIALQEAVNYGGAAVATGSDIDDIYNALPDSTNTTARMRM